MVIGAGPVGLAAAAHLAERGMGFVLVEAGPGPAASVRQWGHVRMFSPWRYNIDAVARRLLLAAGWTPPQADELPTGRRLSEQYLQALAALPEIAPHVRYQARVVAISREGVDRVRSAGRGHAPFVVRLAGGEELAARAVIDASGTWATPNVLGPTGCPPTARRKRPPGSTARCPTCSARTGIATPAATLSWSEQATRPRTHCSP
jgi:thioredoxin reductase